MIQLVSAAEGVALAPADADGGNDIVPSQGDNVSAVYKLAATQNLKLVSCADVVAALGLGQN